VEAAQGETQISLVVLMGSRLQAHFIYGFVDQLNGNWPTLIERLLTLSVSNKGL